MDIIRTLIHTNRDIHGKDCISEFLLPNIAENKPNFIGMTSGKSYDLGLIVSTSKNGMKKFFLTHLKKSKALAFLGENEKSRF